WKRFLKISSSTGSRRMRRSLPEAETENQSMGVSRWSLAGRRQPRVVGSRRVLACGTGFFRRRFVVWPTTNDPRLTTVDAPSRREIFGSVQNCVDTTFILPQYLVLRTLPVPQVG